MEVIETVTNTQSRCEEIRANGRRIALVPTMGFFHDGHLELMRQGKRLADTLVVSIFVNPTQFGPSEDFRSYPRDKDGDLSKAREAGADLVFLPSAGEMYPEGFQTRISVERVSAHLCGLSRPGHFSGVATVVAKLFNITKPHVALFGQKDFQQLAVIRRMVKDLNMDIEIVGVPTVRESDGLAMSSRNTYLNPGERLSALCLKRSIDLARAMTGEGVRDAIRIKTALERLILDHLYTEIDYISTCDPLTMEEIETIEGEYLLALAVKVGKTRLIDNCIIGVA